MNRPRSLERDLATWFADTATPHDPDFTDDIIRLTAGTRQRPRWSFPERWLPMSVITLGRLTLRPLPWRTIGLLAVLALLVLAVLAVSAGSQPRLPAPFGLAGNGLVAYGSGGDVHTVDPISGVRESIASGPDADADPRWSRDGTRMVFQRESGAGVSLAIVDPKRPDKLVTTASFLDLDGDTLAWSPDGRAISFRAQQDGSFAIFIVDTSTGAASPLAVDFPLLDAHWRPPDGRQLMVFGGLEPDLRLYLLTVSDGSVEEVSGSEGSGSIRIAGWTPDGRRFVYQRGERESPPVQTHVLDVVAHEEVIIDVGYGHVSNDGHPDGRPRRAGIDVRGRPRRRALRGGRPAVRSVRKGSCRRRAMVTG